MAADDELGGRLVGQSALASADLGVHHAAIVGEPVVGDIEPAAEGAVGSL